MKSEGAVRHKLKQVLFRHRSKEIQRRLRKEPCNCAFNRTMDLPNGESVSFCLFSELNPDEEPPTVLLMQGGGSGPALCDEKHGGLDQAKECDKFEPMDGPGEIKAEFKDFVETADRAQIAFRYPDAAALLWVLDEGVEGIDVEEEGSEVSLPAPEEIAPLTREELKKKESPPRSAPVRVSTPPFMPDPEDQATVVPEEGRMAASHLPSAPLSWWERILAWFGLQ